MYFDTRCGIPEQLEAALIQVTNEADSLTGQPEIEPAMESGAAP